ncbi:MAG: multicopper oxidase family protein [Paralcaligenes sp.]
MAILQPVTRRNFLNYVGTGAAGLLVGLPQARAIDQAKEKSSAFEADVALELTAEPRSVSLRSGPPTSVWSYHAHLLKGDPMTVQKLPGSYLGPILRVRQGQKIRVDFVNHLNESSIVNWHGLHVPARMMGLPRYEVGPGERYRYEFEVHDRAGTYWYHAMAAGHTPEQVYFGLAGLLLVSDEEEQALSLPRGEYDLPIIIQDRNVGRDNQFRYLPGSGPAVSHENGSSGEAPEMGGGMMGGRGMMSGGMATMMTRMMGFFGDTIFVNGRPDSLIEVATHAYRLRILNASNARTYKLAWRDGRPLTVLATGGGLLERPIHKDYVMLTPGQRIELWADFSKDTVGTQLTLMSLAFESMVASGGMMGMMSNSSLTDGAQFPIARVSVTRKTDEVLELPQRLSTVTRLRAEDAINRSNPRIFRITMGHMQWGFNGRSFEMRDVAANEIVKLGTTEIWEFVNNRMMAHAIHLHGLQFQVLERRNSPKNAGVVDGYVDQGWEDTVLLMPNESVKLLMRFADFTGNYAYQCHMLEHAAGGLMRNYRIEAT